VSEFYGRFYEKVFRKEIDWSVDNIKCILCDDTYIPDKNTHIYKSDVTGIITEIPLTNRTIVYDPKLLTTSLKADDIALDGVTLSGVRTIIIYSDTGTPETSLLIGYKDLEVNRSVTNGVFKIIWDTEGVLVHTMT
jgi:hypothetical protein